MSVIDLRRRMDRIEARRGTGHITRLCNLANHPPELAAEAMRDWRAWVADGRAGRIGSTLVLRPRRMTAAEWSATYAPAPGRLH